MRIVSSFRIKALIIAAFTLCICSCQTKRINHNHVDELVFYPAAKGIERCSGINSFYELMYLCCRDTCITDRNTINNFCRLINQLEFEKTFDVPDIRCAVVIKYTSGDYDCYCFGESHGIQYNGCKSMKYSSALFEYIDEVIYDSQPPDYWQSELDREISIIIKSNIDKDLR